MPRIFMVKEGSQPARGPAWRTEPLSVCVAKLGLKRGDFLAELDRPPAFGDTSSRPIAAEPVAVVVKIEEDEAQAEKWNPGFYGVAMMPAEVRKVFES